MLKEISTGPISVLTLGLRQHGRLLAGRGSEIAAVMKKHDWNCHCCGIRIPEFMEIDHGAGGHTPSCKDLKPICTFCHNLRHPLWAAARGRIIPIHAPDVTQTDLNRMAWMVVAYRNNGAVRVDHVQKAIEARAAAFEQVAGVAQAEPFLEAVMSYRLSMEAEQREGKLIVKHDALTEMDRIVRFWPAEAMRNRDTLPAAALLSTWTLGGFKRAGLSAGKALAGSVTPDFVKLGDTAAKIMEKA